MDRRAFLSSASAAAFGLPFLASCAANPVAGLAAMSPASSAPVGSGDAALATLFDAIFREQVATSPTFATQLGLDKGASAGLRSQLDTRPNRRARAEELARTRRFIALVEAIPSGSLSPTAALNREVVLWDFNTSIVGPARFDIANPQSPYVISQQDGAYFSIPDFLNSSHTIDNAADAEAYLSRLALFATVLDNETAEQRRQAARGFLAPGWSLDLALGQMRQLRAPAAADSGLVTSLASRAAAKDIAGDWRTRAVAIVARDIYPALDRQIAMIGQLRPTTAPGDGVWRVPGGT